jgi:putative ABC transport system permease protein
VGRAVWWQNYDESGDRSFDIVGVVRDTKTRDYFAEPEPTVYLSYPQFAYPTGSALTVATNGDPRGLVTDLDQWLRNYEPYLAIINVVTYTDVVRGYQYTQRMNAELFSVMAFLGMLLAAVGIFSVMALAVVRRTKEIGIRMSVGAATGDIGRLVLRRALAPVLMGLGVGIVASIAMAKMVRGLLFGVAPTDPVSLLGGTVAFLIVAALAAYIPAHRATTVDPIKALRHD